jgi:hypothetical protein
MKDKNYQSINLRIRKHFKDAYSIDRLIFRIRSARIRSARICSPMRNSYAPTESKTAGNNGMRRSLKRKPDFSANILPLTIAMNFRGSDTVLSDTALET